MSLAVAHAEIAAYAELVSRQCGIIRHLTETVHDVALDRDTPQRVRHGLLREMRVVDGMIASAQDAFEMTVLGPAA